MSLSLARFKRLKRRFLYWLDRDARHRQLQDEMDHHLASLARDLENQGLSAAAAQAAAHRKFGNLTLQAEDSRATWISRWFSDFLQDLRYAARTLRRDAGFTTFAILIVGLGIGASSTVYSVVNTLLLRPLPFHDPARLFWFANEASKPEQTLQVGHVVDIRRTLPDCRCAT